MGVQRVTATVAAVASLEDGDMHVQLFRTQLDVDRIPLGRQDAYRLAGAERIG